MARWTHISPALHIRMAKNEQYIFMAEGDPLKIVTRKDGAKFAAGGVLWRVIAVRGGLISQSAVAQVGCGHSFEQAWQALRRFRALSAEDQMWALTRAA